MDSLKMHTPNLADENYRKLAELFPNAVTETITGYDEEGKPIVERAIDKDVLMQEISTHVVEGREERYQFTWPDKKKAILAANAPISATLRPVKEESVGKDGTTGGWDSQNLFIEGDNLDVLKLLQETYLGKVRIIYIDPPYNTGTNFIYADHFCTGVSEYLSHSGQYDEQGNMMEQNTESNGRFHTDWLNMLYPRLKLARNLLSDDGAIFVSIDENELSNLLSIMDEIFGKESFLECIIWDKKASAKGVPPKSMMVNVHEYIVAYSKNKNFSFVGEKRSAEEDGFKNPDNDPRGPWRESNIKSTTKTIDEAFTITDPETGREYKNTWAFSKESLERMIREKRIIWKESLPKQKEFMLELTHENKAIKSNWGVFDAQSTTVYLKHLIPEVHFDNPKPIPLMKYFLNVTSGKEDIILDLFSGSATTAQAVIETNKEDGGKRKFIMVQVEEKIDSETEAFKAGYKNICEIGKERIRRVGKEIKENGGFLANELDLGFRVLHLDSTNMEEVYYNPSELSRDLLGRTVDNIKIERTPEDLLFQVMLDLGIDLSSAIQERMIDGKKVFIVNPDEIDMNYLVACFDSDVTDTTVTEIAKMKPFYAVFRDSGMANDSVTTNYEQIFRTYSPQTERRVL